MNKFDPTPRVVKDTLYEFNSSFDGMPWSEIQKAYRHLESLDLTRYDKVTLDEDTLYAYGHYSWQPPHIIGWRKETKEEIKKRRQVYKRKQGKRVVKEYPCEYPCEFETYFCRKESLS